MRKVKLYHDKIGNTLTVWFDEPKKESLCEEIGEDTVLMLDEKGKVIGFEKFNYYLPHTKDKYGIPIEVITA